MNAPASVAVAAKLPVPVYLRHPLGLPAGSVRGLLTFMILGLFWALVVVSERRETVEVPSYLYYLVFLILGHYFAHRSTVAPGESHPLHLPRGSIRFLILFGFAAALGWAYYQNPEFYRHLKIADRADIPLIVLGTFFLGIIVNKVSNRFLAGPTGLPFWLQDIQAWISLIATAGLVVEVVLRLVINPTLTPEKQLTLPGWEGVLAGLVAFYFGVRS